MADPLMQADFDPVAYLNERFTDENSLGGLETFLLGVTTQINVLEGEISHAVQAQSITGQQASVKITEAGSFIEELFIKMGDIRTKAVSSEKVVQEICADIKKLDIAKTHLQTSITSLKRLQMLITAISQLETLAQELQYRDAANLLDAVKQLLTSFDQPSYNAIPIIAEMRERVSIIQAHLKKHAHRAFREIGQLVDSVASSSLSPSDLSNGSTGAGAGTDGKDVAPGNMKSFSDACLVVDSLGLAARRELLEEFVQLQLVPYESLFAADKPHFTLEQVERRWAWLKRLLKNVDSKFSTICPTHWRLALRLTLEFTERTKVHLVQLLTRLDSKTDSLGIDVHALLKALQSTLRFEQEMAARFQDDMSAADALHSHHTHDSSSGSAHGGGSGGGSREGEAHWQGKSGKAIDNRKLQEEGQVLFIPTDHAGTSVDDSEEQGFLRIAHAAIVGDKSISGIYDKFLGSYVLLERQNLEDMLMRLSSEEDSADGSAGGGGDDANLRGHVFGSSMSMFVFIKNSIKRCTAFSTGITFLSLSQELKACMQQYGELLRKRCPQPEKIANIFPTGGPASTFYPLPADTGAEKAICYLINTGEYCADVVPQLEQMIQTKISSELSDRVDFTTETDLFMDLVALALKVLVSGVMLRINDSFRSMAAISWGKLVSVSEESPYVHTLSRVLYEVVPIVRTCLGEGYFNTFCTKLASSILDTFLDVIVKQKRIAEAASQQLLLDIYSLKTVLTKLHSLGVLDSDGSGKGRKAAPSVYTKLVTSRTAYIETILKLVGTPDEQAMLLERFRILWPEGKASDLLLVTRLKGLNRAQQTQLLEAFGLTAAAAAASLSAQESAADKASSSNWGHASSSLGLPNMGMSQSMRKLGLGELSGNMKKLGLS